MAVNRTTEHTAGNRPQTLHEIGTGPREIVLRFYEEFDLGDLERALSVFSTDLETTDPGMGTVHGLAPFREYLRGLKRAVPDARALIEQVHEAGEMVIVEGRFVGTHTGPRKSPDGDIAPTGASIDLRFADVSRVGDGEDPLVPHVLRPAGSARADGSEVAGTGPRGPAVRRPAPASDRGPPNAARVDRRKAPCDNGRMTRGRRHWVGTLAVLRALACAALARARGCRRPRARPAALPLTAGPVQPAPPVLDDLMGRGAGAAAPQLPSASAPCRAPARRRRSPPGAWPSASSSSRATAR